MKSVRHYSKCCVESREFIRYVLILWTHDYKTKILISFSLVWLTNRSKFPQKSGSNIFFFLLLFSIKKPKSLSIVHFKLPKHWTWFFRNKWSGTGYDVVSIICKVNKDANDFWRNSHIIWGNRKVYNF